MGVTSQKGLLSLPPGWKTEGDAVLEVSASQVCFLGRGKPRVGLSLGPEMLTLPCSRVQAGGMKLEPC